MNWRRVAFFVVYAAAVGAAAYFFRSFWVALWGLLAFVALVLANRGLRLLLGETMALDGFLSRLDRFNNLAEDVSPAMASHEVHTCKALDIYMGAATKRLFEGAKASKENVFPHQFGFNGYLYLMPRFVFDMRGNEVGDLKLACSAVEDCETVDPNQKRLVYFLHYPVGTVADISRQFDAIRTYFDGVTCEYTKSTLKVVSIELKPTMTVDYVSGEQEHYNRMLQVIVMTRTENAAFIERTQRDLRVIRRGNRQWSDIVYPKDDEPQQAASLVPQVNAFKETWFTPYEGPGGCLRDGWIYFGDKYHEGWEPYWISIHKLSHFLVSGQSGSGKSMFLHQFLTGVAHNQRHFDDVYLIDLKGGVELWRYNGRANGLFHVIYKFEDLIGIVDGLNDLMDERLDDMRERGLRDWDGRKVLVVIDEFAEISFEMPEDKEKKAEKQKLIARLTRLASKARAAGIILWAQLQKGTTDVMDSSFRNNLQSEVMFSQKSKLQAAQVFGQTEGLLVDPTRMRPGEFVMYDASVGKVVYLKSRQIKGLA